MAKRRLKKKRNKADPIITKYLQNAKNQTVQRRRIRQSRLKQKYFYDKSKKYYVSDPIDSAIPRKTNIRFFFKKDGVIHETPKMIGNFGKSFDIVEQGVLAVEGYKSLNGMVRKSQFNSRQMKNYIRSYERDTPEERLKYDGGIHYIVYSKRVAENPQSEGDFAGRYISERYNIHLEWNKDKEKIKRLVYLP